MKRINQGTFTLAICIVLTAVGDVSLGQSITELPLLEGAEAGPVEADWLVTPIKRKAAVYRTGATDSAEIALDNGLIRRTFRLAPNAATVALDNLTTGCGVLRGVKPEALVTINGVSYEVGGLKGQPNYAYLAPEWLDQMQADPRAMRLVGFQVGKPAERFGWKQVRHHAPNAVWPPKGVYVRFDYAAPELSVDELLERVTTTTVPPSELGRERLLVDQFKQLDQAWTIHVSKAHERSSFENEGKPGEIYTPANTAVYAERNLPSGTRLVEATMDMGTDRSASWGPGLALVFEDRVVKFHFRPGGGAYGEYPSFGAFNGSAESAPVGGSVELDISKPWTLRLRILGQTILCEGRPQDGTWQTYHTMQFDAPLPDPMAVRVGKMDQRGGAADFNGEPGDLVRTRMLGVAAYGPLEPEAVDKLVAELAEQRKVRVAVHYELYDGVPVMSKWITVHNPTEQTITVDRFTSELLAVVEHANWVEKREGVVLPRPSSLHVETDFAFGGFTSENSSNHVVHWRADPDYTSQVNYLRETPCLLTVEPTFGPAQDVKPGETFESYRTFTLVHDSTDRGRRALAVRRMYRTIAPWVTENPLMMHMRTANPDAVRGAIDQCAEVGFEMLILSFGSGFNIENEDPAYMAGWKDMAAYARGKGVEIGGYSLLASRRVGGGNDVVSPQGQRPTFGNCPALTSDWGQDYFRKLYQFFGETDFMLLEHDGSYPGDLDITPRPPLQKGGDDSRWVQWRVIRDFYQWCRANGVFLNVPDFYYLSGSNKCGMGYREVNWSLPRAQQVIHTRQNIYDGTWSKTPSMGWMFVPLTQYHGGGAAATVEPLHEHLDHYERMIVGNLGAGVQACYRGPRLYDTEETRAMVVKWVEWYKRYRDILESDIVHESSRRADGRDIDWMLHANSSLAHKGLLMVYNPLDRPVKKTISLSLYYTGLTDSATIRCGEGPAERYLLDREYRVNLPVEVPAASRAWFVIE